MYYCNANATILTSEERLLWREYISSTLSYFLVLALDHSTHDVFYCSYAKYYYDVASIVKNYNCVSYSDNYIKR